jgi:hypothetical protein
LTLVVHIHQFFKNLLCIVAKKDVDGLRRAKSERDQQVDAEARMKKAMAEAGNVFVLL